MAHSIKHIHYSNNGSTELIAIGLICALIVIIALPLLAEMGDLTESNLGDLYTEMQGNSQVGIN